MTLPKWFNNVQFVLNLPSQKGTMCNLPISMYPMQLVGIDLIHFQNDQYPIMPNRYSGYVWIAIMSPATTRSVTDQLFLWFLEYNFPDANQSDGGPQFRETFTLFCKDHQIAHELASSYNPESNGLAKRMSVGDQQCLELPGFINPAIGTEQARGPMTRTRTNSNMQSEAPSLEGPYQLGCNESKAGTPRATDLGTEGPLRKVKKMNKPKKKESKKMGEKKKEILTEVMQAGGLQQEELKVEDTPDGEKRQLATRTTRSRVVTARSLAQMMEGPSWMVRPDVYCTGLYKGEPPTMTASELMEWDHEEGIVNRAFTNQLVTMELIDFLERSKGTRGTQTMLEDLHLEDIDAVQRSIKMDAFDKVLPEDYGKIRDYL